MEIQTAVAALTSGGTVLLGPDTFNMSFSSATPNYISLKSNLRIKGSGMGRTILQGGVANSWMFRYVDGPTQVENVIIEDLTIDLQNVTDASAIQAWYSKNFILRNVEFKNADEGWFFSNGVSDGSTEGILCENLHIENCIFDTHTGILEMVLLFNTQDAWITDCTFKNKNDNGPTVGLWQ